MNKLFLALLLGLASLGGCNLPKPEIHGTLKTTRALYVTRAGFIPNPKPTQQNLAFLKSGNISAYSWTSQEPKEVDFGFRYHHALNDKLSARAGIDIWTYPGKNNPLGTKDTALEAGLNYSALSSTLNIDITLTQVLKDDDARTGQMIHATFSRPIQLGRLSGIELSLSPCLSAAYLKNYYGAEGLSQITLGAPLRASKNHWFMEFFLKKQFGNEKAGTRDFNYAGLSIGYEF